MRISRKLSVTYGLVILTAMVCLTVSVAPAAAFLDHVYSGRSFGPGGPEIGTFFSVRGLAVDQSTEDVYVFDPGYGTLYKFNAAGEPVNFSALGGNTITGLGGTDGMDNQVAIDNSTGATAGDIYVANNAEVVIFAPDGTRLGRLTGGSGSEPCGVSVDGAGDVYVGNVTFTSTGAIKKYVPEGNPVKNSNLISSMIGLPDRCNLAVDSTGNSIYSALEAGEIRKYVPAEFGPSPASGTLLDPRGVTLTVDQTTGKVYVDEGGDIATYAASGEPAALLERFGESEPGQLSRSDGVAVNGTTGHSASGNVYAGSEGLVNIYRSVLLPDASTEQAFGVTNSEAVLYGAVNPDGTSVTSCEFEYGTSESLGQSVPCSQALPLSGNSTVPVSATVTGLQADTTYFYRVSPGNAAGVNTAQGSQQSFTTSPAVDGVSTLAASAVTKTTATLNGALSPDGVDAHYYFEYSTGETPASSFGCLFDPECKTSPAPPGTDAGASNATVVATTGLTGLTAGTVYHYRLVAVNAEGSTSFAAEKTFTTTPAVGNVKTEAATNVSLAAATLHGSLAAENGSVTYFFEYGTEAEVYGSQTAELTSPSSVAESAPVEAVLSGLQPNTIYHFRLVASNSSGITRGADQQFNSGAAAPQNSQTLSASGITPTTGVLSGGVVNPENSPTSYYYVYISEAGYQAALAQAASNPYAEGSVTASVELGSGNTPQELPPAPIGGLLAETTYHYALTATNAAGTTRSPDAVFTTGAKTPPKVTTGPPAGVTQNVAVLTATIHTEGLVATYGFELAVSGGAYGPPTGLGSVNLGASEQSVSLGIAGLLPGTTYVYRVEASNLDGTSYGAPQEFTTPVFQTPFATPPAPLSFLAIPTIAFPVEAVDSATAPKALTKAQKLAKALKACKTKPRSKRASCQKQATKKYAPPKKKGRKK